jgi:Bacterial Ig domain/Carbohydrate binding module (family 35)/Secretion system C-terminal sorting domain/Cellulase (glycosyl hydrolase family 5)
MKNLLYTSIIILICSIMIKAQGQFMSSGPLNRVIYNDQQLFLSGSNLAWVSYGQDIGLGTTDTTSIGNWMIQMHQHGGNAMRMWLSHEGQYGYTFDAQGRASGLAPNTISDMKKVLKLGWAREIGVIFCLWGFDMLRTDLDTSILHRNEKMLSDTSYTNAYIRNCLIPMVKALKGDPDLISWEIMNEPEGMSTEFGWSTNAKTPMKNIQRFINLFTGAIHRADPTAKVTSGAVTLASLTDVLQPLNKSSQNSVDLNNLTNSQKQDLQNWFNNKYHLNLPVSEIIFGIQNLTAADYNYYRDDRLIAAGGDSLGILDFYCVHYYENNGIPHLSPFTHAASLWKLTKPVVVAEFGMQNGSTLAIDGVKTADLFDSLYTKGYAGALPWAWSDNTYSTKDQMIAGMQTLWNKYRPAVDLLGSGGDWPVISIASPQDGSVFPTGSQVTITATVTDSLAITSVDFYAGTNKIGTVTASPYTYIWSPADGNYTLSAIATNGQGHKQTSGIIQITVGTLKTRLEAETATLKGPGMKVVTDNTASGHKYVDIQAADSTSTITWIIPNVTTAGTYQIAFGFRMPYGTPKTQFLNINGMRADSILFNGTSASVWYEISKNVTLVAGSNTIQMQMWWSYMQLDYLSVSASTITSVDNLNQLPTSYSLSQNYPNPFNPTTNIKYSIIKESLVTLKVFDILGREVENLVNTKQVAGSYQVNFNASKLASGVYIYRLIAGDFVKSMKMMLIK